MFIGIVFAMFILSTAMCLDSGKWDCIEIGPLKEKDIDNPYGQETRGRHEVSEENVRQLQASEKNGTGYTPAEIEYRIDKKLGDQYMGFPLVCTKGNETVKFINHPYVVKSFLNGKSTTKSATGSFMMMCEVFKLAGHKHDSNFTWIWYKKSFDGKNADKWQEMDLMNNTDYYSYTEDYVDNINYNSTLKIKSLNKEDAGDYKCLAWNRNGDHEAVFELNILGIQALFIPYGTVFFLVMIQSILVFIYERMNAKKQQKQEELEMGRQVRA